MPLLFARPFSTCSHLIHFMILVQVISGAGHHIFADKPEVFNEYVNAACRFSDSLPEDDSGELLINEDEKTADAFNCTNKPLMSCIYFSEILALEEKENDSQITASRQDTNGFAKIPKLIESEEVPVLNSNILIK